MKIYIIFLSALIISSCSAVRVTNVNKNDDNTVDIPLRNSLNTGWILLNEYEISMYDYQKKQTKSSINYYPIRGYGDLFFLNEYVGMEEKDFYAGISLYKLQAKLNKKNSNTIDWGEYTGTNEVINLFTSSVNEVADENDLDAALKQSIIDKFIVAGSLNENEIKTKTNQTIINIHKYPPAPIIDGKNRIVKTFSVRKDFSTFTVKASALFIPEIDAFTTGAYISIYPAVNFASYEKYAYVLDNISIDIGVANDAKNDSAKEDFNASSEKYLFGVGYDLGSNFSFQIGTVIWDNGNKLDTALSIGISLDLLNLASGIVK